MSNATAELKPEVKVEDAGPAKKRITVTVQAKDVDARLENGFGNLAGEAALPGFRKGKAPRALLERRFGDMLLQETRTQLLGETYGKVVQDHKLRPVGEPSLPEGATEPTLTQQGLPNALHNWIAAEPTPLAPACSSTLSPASKAPRR